MTTIEQLHTLFDRDHHGMYKLSVHEILTFAELMDEHVREWTVLDTITPRTMSRRIKGEARLGHLTEDEIKGINLFNEFVKAEDFVESLKMLSGKKIYSMSITRYLDPVNWLEPCFGFTVRYED